MTEANEELTPQEAEKVIEELPTEDAPTADADVDFEDEEDEDDDDDDLGEFEDEDDEDEDDPMDGRNG